MEEQEMFKIEEYSDRGEESVFTLHPHPCLLLGGPAEAMERVSVEVPHL